MILPGYDAWKLASPYDDEELTEEEMEELQEKESEREEYEYDRYRDEMMERRYNDDD